MARITLGDRVKDKITGLKGIAIARTSWLYGCDRITVQPEECKDGKTAECQTFDEEQIEVVKAGVISAPTAYHAVQAPATRPGGPRPEPQRRSDPKR